MTFTPSRRPRLWFSNAPSNNPLDQFHRDIGYVRDPPGWVRECFRMAKALGMDLVICMPNGYDGVGGYKAGDFLDDDARSAFMEEIERFPHAAGLYIGRALPGGVTLDPSNQATREFFRVVLLPYVKSGMKILGGDDVADTWAAAQRLHDACACFGVSFFGEGVPYWKPALYRNMPWAGTVEDYVNNADPGLTTVHDPARTEIRVRVEMGKDPALEARLRANNVIVDLMSWVGAAAVG